MKFDHYLIAQRNEIIDRKKEAIAAVAAAKKDLLRHSLDMMVFATLVVEYLLLS